MIPYAEIDPGIRHVVWWFNSQGYATTDSGDGVSKIAAGWPADEVLTVPHVAIPVRELHRLIDVADFVGAQVQRLGIEGASVEGTYLPLDRVALVMVFGVDDAALLAALPPSIADHLREVVALRLAQQE